MSERVDPYDQILDLAKYLLAQDQKPESVLVCPICGGQLHFSAGVRKGWGEPSGSMMFVCRDCNAGAALDGMTPIPKWMRPED